MGKLLMSIVCGVVFFAGAIFCLMHVGLYYHANYEYYGEFPALYVIPGLIGLCLPMCVSRLQRSRRQSSPS